MTDSSANDLPPEDEVGVPLCDGDFLPFDVPDEPVEIDEEFADFFLRDGHADEVEA